MHLQIIKDGQGNNTGIFIPITDWDLLTQKHTDLKQLVSIEYPLPQKKLSDLAGKLSQQTAEEMLKYVLDGREGWEDRLNKQL